MNYNLLIHLLSRFVSSENQSFLSSILVNSSFTSVDPSIWRLSSLESECRKQNGLWVQDFDRFSGGFVVLSDDSSPWWSRIRDATEWLRCQSRVQRDCRQIFLKFIFSILIFAKNRVSQHNWWFYSLNFIFSWSLNKWFIKWKWQFVCDKVPKCCVN